MPSAQFTPQSARPLTPRQYRAAVRRMRELLAEIDTLAEAVESRQKGVRTRAINVLSYQAKDLARRNARHPEPGMAMLPNDHHPGPRCSCRPCVRDYPSDPG